MNRGRGEIRQMKRFSKVLAMFVFASLLSVITVVQAGAATRQSDFADVPQKHWGYANIKWAAESGIVEGDGKGNFNPNAEVTETEFLVMLVRAYQEEIKVPAPSGSEKWFDPYYTIAYGLEWPVYHFTSGPYNRGQVANLIASMAGKDLSNDESIQYLLDQGLAKGKTSNTIAGFGARDSLTRAEAVTFIKNVKDKRPSLTAVSDNGLKLFGIAMGDTEQSVVDKMGEPGRKDPSEYGFTWFIFNGDYAKYAQIGIQDGKVVALYSNAPGAWHSASGIRSAIFAQDLSQIIGKPIEQGKQFYDSGSYEETIYYLDNHDNNKVDAILLQSKLATRGVYDAQGSKDDSLTKAYERQVFDLTNVFRMKNGIGLLQWDDQIADTARKHSKDMEERGYFEHTNPDGLSPFDRMKADGISYSSAAENIAYGYSDAFHVYNGWLNSLGHRRNMLNGNLQRLGVGIFKHQYTQNFYTPR